MKKITVFVLALAVMGMILTGCAGTDVVLNYSRSSFETIAGKYPDLVTDNTKTDNYYVVTVDGETTLKISSDYNLTGTDDIMIETPLQPFVDAGLDVSKLGDGYKAAGDKLYMATDFGSGTGGKNTVTDALLESVKADRDMLSYHQDLDHFGITLMAGKFEWAKDYAVNDKDIVFVINAKPLKDLGVEVNNIAGWTLATMKDMDGADVELLLKPYNLD